MRELEIDGKVVVMFCLREEEVRGKLKQRRRGGNVGWWVGSFGLRKKRGCGGNSGGERVVGERGVNDTIENRTGEVDVGVLRGRMVNWCSGGGGPVAENNWRRRASV